MIEQGKIINVENDTVTLSCSGLSGGCKSCKANSFCSANGHDFDALNEDNLDLKSGDVVEIYLPTGRTVFSGFMVLIFPLITFMLLFAAGSVLLGLTDGWSTLLGLGGLSIGFGITALYNRFYKRKNTPRVVKKLDKEDDQPL